MSTAPRKGRPSRTCAPGDRHPCRGRHEGGPQSHLIAKLERQARLAFQRRGQNARTAADLFARHHDIAVALILERHVGAFQQHMVAAARQTLAEMTPVITRHGAIIVMRAGRGDRAPTAISAARAARMRQSRPACPARSAPAPAHPMPTNAARVAAADASGNSAST